jgi:hypothetical protein
VETLPAVFGLSYAKTSGENVMANLVGWLGSVVGVIGLAVCLVAGLARLTGHFTLGGFEAMTLFNAGVGLMVAGCLGRLHAR